MFAYYNTPLGALRWGPQIADYTEQCKCKNVPESSDDPSTLPSLIEWIGCFEVDLYEQAYQI